MRCVGAFRHRQPVGRRHRVRIKRQVPRRPLAQARRAPVAASVARSPYHRRRHEPVGAVIAQVDQRVEHCARCASRRSAEPQLAA